MLREDPPPFHVGANSHHDKPVRAATDKPSDDEKVWRMRLTGELLKRERRFTIIDAFAGAGGKTLGFSKKFGHPFDSVWANDIDADCIETYNANFGNHGVCGDIFEVLKNLGTKIPKADVVIGGPPCQGFSNLNQQKNVETDPRRELWRGFMELVERADADVFVMENVPPLLRSREYLEIVRLAKKLGFAVRSAQLCAADYGVPQLRKRAFVIGCRFADPESVFPPKKTHYPLRAGKPERPLFQSYDEYVVDPSPWRTVKDVIADLPRPRGTEKNGEPPLDLHFGRNRHRLVSNDTKSWQRRA